MRRARTLEQHVLEQTGERTESFLWLKHSDSEGAVASFLDSAGSQSLRRQQHPHTPLPFSPSALLW